MKNTFFKIARVFSLVFSFNILASNTTMVHVSSQKVNNATLTCPSGKWCRVVVNYSLTFDGSGSSAAYVSPMVKTYEVLLRSGEAISAGVTNTTNVNAWYSYIDISVAGSIISRDYATCTPSGGSPNCTVRSNYSFYSMEYWN